MSLTASRGEPFARFDDACSGDSFVLHGYKGEIVGRSPADVADVLRAVDVAAREGAWVAGFVSYDAAPGVNQTLTVRMGDSTTPLAWFGIFTDKVVAPEPSPPVNAEWALDQSEAAHAAAVATIRDLIAVGDVYQVNLTARAHASVGDPAALYEGLRRGQRGAYNALIVTPTHAVACASPELFFELDGRDIVTRPMKGTAERGRWPAEDRARRASLRSSAKERAENLMIVDLIRNDLGRIAEYGSVQTPRLFDAERYPTVWQLTSTVRATLRADVNLVEIFATLFPSGSVTGAPKRAAMQAIAQLETRPRGVYCGAVGVCAPGPRRRAWFAVAIRTATTDLATGETEYGAGGGITWDSDAAAERHELVVKTAILKPVAQFCGLFETMRCLPDGSVRNVERHLDRMAESAAYIDIPFDGAAALTLMATCHPGRIRLDLDVLGNLSVRQDPLRESAGPVRLGWCAESVDSDDRRLFHKTVDRAGFERRRASRPDADDVLLVNERDEVTETTTANVAVRIGGRWWTPALTCGLLPGVERARLLEDGTLAERRIGRSDVASGELAVVSSLRGWRAATLIDGG